MFSFIAKNKKLDRIINHFEVKHTLLLKKPTEKNKSFSEKPFLFFFEKKRIKKINFFLQQFCISKFRKRISITL